MTFKVEFFVDKYISDSYLSFVSFSVPMVPSLRKLQHTGGRDSTDPGLTPGICSSCSSFRCPLLFHFFLSPSLAVPRLTYSFLNTAPFFASDIIRGAGQASKVVTIDIKEITRQIHEVTEATL
jgi:hypothetical protein